MPIIRKYVCDGCFHTAEVELAGDEWDTPSPFCPHCDGVPLGQEFAVHIGGSPTARAADMALRIAAEDYGVADLKSDGREGGVPKVRYKDTSPSIREPDRSSWAVPAGLEAAIAVGRQDRLANGSALDAIKQMPDLIELSRRRSARVW